MFHGSSLRRTWQITAAGQKKKVLLAASLCTQAHLYVWDEPLNFIDVISRMQVEDLLLACRPTLLFVEHDARFCDEIATRRIRIQRNDSKQDALRSCAEGVRFPL